MIVPMQLSKVVGTVTVAEHCPVMVDKVGEVGLEVLSTITVCGTVMLFPFPSLNVQLTVNVPCVEYVNGSVVVPVIVPAQLSAVVGAVTVAEHCPVTVAKVGVAGGVTS